MNIIVFVVYKQSKPNSFSTPIHRFGFAIHFERILNNEKEEEIEKEKEN